MPIAAAPKGDEGRDVEGTHPDNREARPVRRILEAGLRSDAGGPDQGERLAEDAPLRNGRHKGPGRHGVPP